MGLGAKEGCIWSFVIFYTICPQGFSKVFQAAL